MQAQPRASSNHAADAIFDKLFLTAAGRADPYPLYHQLRQAAPVHRTTLQKRCRGQSEERVHFLPSTTRDHACDRMRPRAHPVAATSRHPGNPRERVTT
jgi:hypothetical protein